MLLKKDFKIHVIDASIFFNIHFHINTYLVCRFYIRIRLNTTKFCQLQCNFFLQKIRTFEEPIKFSLLPVTSYVNRAVIKGRSSQNSQVLNSKRFHEGDVFLVKTLGISLCSYKLTGLAGVRQPVLTLGKYLKIFSVSFSVHTMGNVLQTFFHQSAHFWLNCTVLSSSLEVRNSVQMYVAPHSVTFSVFQFWITDKQFNAL